MQCPGCGYPHSSVVWARRDERSGSSMTRRRECLKCGGRFTTTENRKEPGKPGRPRGKADDITGRMP